MSIQSGHQKTQKGITVCALTGCLLIGIGVGYVINNVSAGIFLGLGAGCITLLLLRAKA